MIRGVDLFREDEYPSGYDHLDAYRVSLNRDWREVEPPPDPREVQRLLLILQRGETDPGTQRLLAPFNTMDLSTGVFFPEKPWEIDAVRTRPSQQQRMVPHQRFVAREQARETPFKRYITKCQVAGAEDGNCFYKVDCCQYLLGPVDGGLHFDSPRWTICMEDEKSAIDCVLYHKAFSHAFEVLLGAQTSDIGGTREYDEHYLSSEDNCTTEQVERYRTYRESILEDFASMEALYSVDKWEGLQDGLWKSVGVPCLITGITHASESDLAVIQGLNGRTQEWLRTVTWARHRKPRFSRTYLPPRGVSSPFHFRECVIHLVHNEELRDVEMETDRVGQIKKVHCNIVHMVRLKV